MQAKGKGRTSLDQDLLSVGTIGFEHVANPLDLGLTDGGAIKMKDSSDAAHRNAPSLTNSFAEQSPSPQAGKGSKAQANSDGLGAGWLFTPTWPITNTLANPQSRSAPPALASTQA